MFGLEPDISLWIVGSSPTRTKRKISRGMTSKELSCSALGWTSKKRIFWASPNMTGEEPRMTERLSRNWPEDDDRGDIQKGKGRQVNPPPFLIIIIIFFYWLLEATLVRAAS